MFKRITIAIDGKMPPGAAVSAPEVSAEHVDRLKNLLDQSPAGMSDIPLSRFGDADLKLEWQSVFQGAAVVYIHRDRTAIAAGLMLAGQFQESDLAAIDAVLQMLQSSRAKSPAFDTLKRCRERPLRALLFIGDNHPTEIVHAVEYWMDCFARAYFPAAPQAPLPSSQDAACTAPAV